jgi:hypothetical protein
MPIKTSPVTYRTPEQLAARIKELKRGATFLAKAKHSLGVEIAKLRADKRFNRKPSKNAHPAIRPKFGRVAVDLRDDAQAIAIAHKIARKLNKPVIVTDERGSYVSIKPTDARAPDILQTDLLMHAAGLEAEARKRRSR